jgi:DUF971 family protein
MRPVKIEIVENKYLKIIWNDDSSDIIRLTTIRRFCPCAECQELRQEQGPKYIPIYRDFEVAIKEIKPVGNYALNIWWEDNHKTGIYEYSFLKKLSEITSKEVQHGTT